MIYAGTRGYLDALPVEAIRNFENGLLTTLRGSHAKLLAGIRDEKQLTKELEAQLKNVLDTFAKNFTA